MGNTLTAIAPTLYSAAQQVSAEPFGLIDSIMADFNDQRVAKGDVVKVPYAPVAALADFTPAAISTAGTDKVAATVSVAITFSKKTAWHLTGEQQRSLENAGTNTEWIRQLVAQGMRALRNYAESQCWDYTRKAASRAYGTAATTPFATDLSALTNVRKILQDNGAPLADLQFVMDTTAGLNARNLGILQQAYQAGSDVERRTGQFLRQFGFQLKESAAIGIVTKGTGGSYTSDTAGHAIAETDIPLITGTGTVLAGDVVTYTGDTNKYVVNVGVAAPGTISLGRPGLRKALAASAVAMTVGGDFTANLAFERSAVVGIMRPPAFPENKTIDQLVISDDKGMSYLMLDIQQYGMRTWELHLAGGFQGVQSEHIAIVLG